MAGGGKAFLFGFWFLTFQAVFFVVFLNSV